MRVVLKILILVLFIIVIMLPVNTFNSDKKVDIKEDSIIIAPLTPEPKPSKEIIQTEVLKPREKLFSELAPTILMSQEELTFDNPYIADKPNPPLAGTYKLVVNIYYQFITVLEKDKNGEFNIPVRYMICSTGKETTPTPMGVFSIEGYKTKIISSEDYSARYATQLTDEIYFHSILYRKWDDTTSYTESSYNNLGSRVSHGCIRLWVPDAKWIFYNVAAGTEVEIIESKNDQDAAIKEQLVFSALSN